MDETVKLFEKPLPSSRTGAFFNAFSYPTKISPESIAVYIATTTQPGDLVLDTFGGSGSTGIAALLCERPTEKMMEIANELGVTPVWGSRNVVTYEIGTYGAYAAKTISNRLKAKDFMDAVNLFIKEAEKELGDYYKTIDNDGNEGTIRYVIWSEVLRCPHCGNEMPYFKVGVQRNPVKFFNQFVCEKCGSECDCDQMEFVTEDYYDSILHKNGSRKKRIPVWLYGSTGNKNWDREINEFDIRKNEIIDGIPYETEAKEIAWGDLYRKGYHYGVTHLHHFYTKRNYIVMDKLWKMTERYDERVRDALKLLLLSYNSSHCTLMTRVVAKKDSKDFVLTGSQSGVLYISKLPVEKNILLGLKRKAKPISDVYELLECCTGSYTVNNCSSQNLKEEDKSVSLVFTDPPFGDFIPYAEVNQINELWLSNTTNRENEIIISSSQGKTVEQYQKMLTDVFSEIHRVLMDDANAMVVFHSAKADVWEAFEKVISQAGLTVKLTNILNKKQSSFKQIVSEGSVQGDPLLLLSKSEPETSLSEDDSLLYQIVKDMQGKEGFDERRIYSLYVNRCLEQRVRVKFDAKEAYRLIRKITEVV